MKLAIVGSVSLAGNAEAERIIEEMLDQLRPVCVVSGGAPGIDTMAVEAAERRGIATSVHLPRTHRWEDGFKPRNILVAEECDRLVRIVASDSKTYGSGWTRDYAAKRGKPTKEYIVEVPAVQEKVDAQGL